MYGKLALTMRITTITSLYVARASDDFLLPCVSERWVCPRLMTTPIESQSSTAS